MNVKRHFAWRIALFGVVSWLTLAGTVRAQSQYQLTVAWTTSGSWNGLATLVVTDSGWTWVSRHTNSTGNCENTISSQSSGTFSASIGIPAAPSWYVLGYSSSPGLQFTYGVGGGWETTILDYCGSEFTTQLYRPEASITASPVFDGSVLQGYDLSTNTIYPPNAFFADSQTTVTASGFLPDPIELRLGDPSETLLDATGHLINDPDGAARAVSLFPRIGTTADGTSKLLIVVHTDRPYLSISMNFGSLSPAGVLACIPGWAICNNIGGGKLAIGTVHSDSRQGYSRIAVAAYTPANSFSDYGITLRAVSLLRFRLSVENGPSKFVNLRKTPIVVVHGFKSDPTTWTSLFLGGLRKFDYVTGQPIQINTGSETIELGTDVYTADYSGYTGDGFDPHGPNVGVWSLDEQYRKAIDQLHVDGFAATRVDVIGHSMGGLIARAYAQLPSYRTLDAYQRGPIHRLVTIGTPHLGSKIAPYAYTYLLTPADSTLQTFIQRYMGAQIEGIRQLIPGSTAYQDLASTCVPSHTIAGVYPPDLGVPVQEIGSLVSLILGTPPIDSVFGTDLHDLAVDIDSQTDQTQAGSSVIGDIVHLTIDPLLPESETNSERVSLESARVLTGSSSEFVNCLPSPVQALTIAKPPTQARVMAASNKHLRDVVLNGWRAVTMLISSRQPGSAASITSTLRTDRLHTKISTVPRLSLADAANKRPLNVSVVGGTNEVLFDGNSDVQLQATVNGSATEVFFVTPNAVVRATAPDFVAVLHLGPNTSPGPLPITGIAAVDGIRSTANLQLTVVPTEQPTQFAIRQGSTVLLTDSSPVQLFTNTGQPAIWLEPVVTYSWSTEPTSVSAGINYDITGAEGIIKLDASTGQITGLRNGETTIDVAFGGLHTSVSVTVACTGTGAACATGK